MSLALTERQEREIEAFCRIAKESGAVVSLKELIGLAAIEASEHQLAAVFDSDSNLSSKFLLRSGYVLERSSEGEGRALKLVVEEEARRWRAQANLGKARRFAASLARGAVVLSVSGGNSYLSAAEQEDIDFFCVTKTNGMWPFVLKALIIAKIHRLANGDVPALCFSCIMDEEWARRAFRNRQNAIFARDALTAKVISGTSAYGALLEEASWMQDYFPAFYEIKLRETKPRGPSSTPGGGEGRLGSVVLNRVLHLGLGSFLRMKSWALNRKLAKSSRQGSIFTTRVGPGHYIYESNRYRKLGSMYSGLWEGA